MIDKQQVKMHFDKNVSSYDQYAIIQKKMANILIKQILNRKDTIPLPKSILEIGCGTGYLTNLLRSHFPCSHITAIDISPGMINMTKSKFINNNISFICGDIEEIPLINTYDIIISNATFQWFNNTLATVQKLYSALSSKGTLCFSTFGNHTFSELSVCFKKVGNEMYPNNIIHPSQQFYTLNELHNICIDAVDFNSNHNKAFISCKELFEYESFNSCKDFFNSIKKIGANNSNMDRRHTSPIFIKRVMDYYDANFMENNNIKATYHCIFASIVK